MKTIFFISMFYPPMNLIAVERAMKWTFSLSQKCDNLVVFSMGCDGISESWIDTARYEEISRQMPANVRIRRVDSLFKNFTHIDSSKSYFKLENILGILSYVFFSDIGLWWLLPLNKQIKSEILRQKPDLIVVTGSSFLSMLVAKWIKAKYGIDYVADYKDLWCNRPDGHRSILGKFFSCFFEKGINDNASAITTVSNGCVQGLAGCNKNKVSLYNFPNDNYVKFVLSCANDIKPYSFAGSGEIHLLFQGTLYAGQRSLLPIFQAIKLLEPALCKKIKVHYYGLDTNEIEADAKAAGVVDNLVVHGRVSKTEALQALFKADVLISLIHLSDITNDEAIKGIISGKIFEYLIANKPIINIAPVNAEINELLGNEKNSYFHSFTSSNIQGISNLIKSIVVKTYPGKNNNDIPTWEKQFEIFWGQLKLHLREQ